MTDKQIRIDGCDVSGCKFYNTDDETCRELNGKYDIVEDCIFDKCMYFNCYYKQLKRKEQECEELKEKIVKNKCEEIGKETFLEWKIKKLHQALTDIKEMLQVITETNNVYPLQNNLNKILQKISECEVEDENN